MLSMVIERFKDQNLNAVYRRFREHGRMTPDGLVFIGSWVEVDDLRLFQQWVAHWHDLAEFELVPVVESKYTAEAITPLP
jgi:hypothetical protein